MTHRNALKRSEFTVRLEKSHEEIHAAFVHAMRETRCTQKQASDGMDVNIDTIRNYKHGRTHVNVARVLAFPKLRDAFLLKLCSGHREPVGYVARKRGRAT